ncbi:MIP18 protein galla-2 [Dinochytrium kinnereticum]|nr:MIP18 protein galla-2 [Dinochytrium kinnereticum]
MQVDDNRELENSNPKVFEPSQLYHRKRTADDENDAVADPFDSLEVFDLIRHINDPEHPLTLEQLNVAQLEQISVDNDREEIVVRFTPTIPHCSMATLIGLCIRVRLLRTLPDRFKVDIRVMEGTHQSEVAVNKQLNDKERVAAALENSHLLDVVNQCLKTAVEKS